MAYVNTNMKPFVLQIADLTKKLLNDPDTVKEYRKSWFHIGQQKAQRRVRDIYPKETHNVSVDLLHQIIYKAC